MAKTFIKKKSGPNQSGPRYRTPDFFKGKITVKGFNQIPKFNPAKFKTQHKG